MPSPIEVDRLFRDVWRVVEDPPDFEYIRAPKFQAERFFDTGILEGDCDDSAVLSCCLLYCIRWPVAMVAIRRPHDVDYSHVFTVAPQGNTLVHIDPIVPASHLPIPPSEIADAMMIAM